jgi:hypothetical protein
LDCFVSGSRVPQVRIGLCIAFIENFVAFVEFAFMTNKRAICDSRFQFCGFQNTCLRRTSNWRIIVGRVIYACTALILTFLVGSHNIPRTRCRASSGQSPVSHDYVSGPRAVEVI